MVVVVRTFQIFIFDQLAKMEFQKPKHMLKNGRHHILPVLSHHSDTQPWCILLGPTKMYLADDLYHNQ